MTDDSEFSGGCLCGGVRFAATPPVIFCAHCHCDFCRRAHGAAFVTWVGVQEAHFRVVEGEELLTWHASSKQGRRGFCARCGSTMLYKSSVCPGEVHIALANVDGSIDRKPEVHVFFDSSVDWFTFGDDLMRLHTDSEFLTKFKSVET
jgi:hypothetical protein